MTRTIILTSMCLLPLTAYAAEAILPIRATIVNCTTDKDMPICRTIGVGAQLQEPLFVDEICNGDNSPPECIEPSAGEEEPSVNNPEDCPVGFVCRIVNGE